MFPRPPQLSESAIPKLPLPYPLYDEQPLQEVFQKFLSQAAAENTGYVLSTMARGDCLLLSAIDPATGDSALHRAAAVGNVDFIAAIPPAFGTRLDPESERLLWALIVHRNLAGDTALHAAAKTGSLRGAKAVYRTFHLDSLDLDDTTRGPGSDDPAAEYWEWDNPTDEDDFDGPLPALAFVCAKNLSDRDAAAEAEAAGHHNVATFLHSLAQSLDHGGRRSDKGYLDRAWKLALKGRKYYEADS